VIVDGLRRNHPLNDPFLHRLRGRQPPIPFRGRFNIMCQTELELMKNGLLHGFGGLFEVTMELGLVVMTGYEMGMSEREQLTGRRSGVEVKFGLSENVTIEQKPASDVAMK